MANLIQELGADRFLSKFFNSFFYDPEGVPSRVTNVDRHSPELNVHCTAVSGPAHNVRVNNSILPAEFFSGIGVFKTPKLGWRSVADGRVLVYLSRNNRSYHRGTSPKNLNVELSQLTRWLQRSGNYNFPFTDNKLCALTMTPNYMSFAQGVEQMRRGNILSFAVSPEIAVTPGPQDTLDIYFRTIKGGKVLANGNIEVTVPLLATYLEDTQ